MGCGGLLQLVALGVQDDKLTRDPQGNFFEASYNTYVNFAMEEIENTFNGTVGFGKRVQVDLQRNGDLVWQMLLEVVLPELGQFQNPDPLLNTVAPGGVCWAPNIGHTLIKNAEVIIGGCEIDKHYGIWFDVSDELTLTAEHLRGYHRMIGQQEPMKEFSGQGIQDADGVAYKNGTAAVHEVVYGLQTPRNGPVGSPYLVPVVNTVAPIATNSFIAPAVPTTPVPLPGEGPAVSDSAVICHPQTTLQVPMRFWFNKNPGLALPLIALQFQQVRVQIEFRPRNECISLVPDALGVIPAVDVSSGQPELQGGNLWVNYIFLDNDARQYMAQNPHEYLIKQLQFNQGEGVTAANSRVTLNFNHPTTELVWFTQENDCVDQVAANPNEWHVGDPTVDPEAMIWKPQLGGNQWNQYEVADYTGPLSTSLGVGAQAIEGQHFNPLTQAQLRMNGQDRFAARIGAYFNEVQPYYHHTRVPESKGVFVYSFAISPEEHQPQGTANLSRIDTLTLNLNLNNITPNGNPGSVYVFACNYNFLRVAGGMAGVAFAA